VRSMVGFAGSIDHDSPRPGKIYLTGKLAD
jgi:hypothetical protein